MIYGLNTAWQADDYVVRVQTGLFLTPEEAQASGNQSMQLVRNNNRLVLRDYKTGKELDEAFDNDIQVFKLKESSSGRPIVNFYDDYEQVGILIANFGNYHALSSFSFLSCSVDEATKLGICGDNGEPLVFSVER